MRPLRAIIHARALQHNLALAKAHAPRSRVFSVIKADGYGHGLLRAASALAETDAYAVLGIEDGATLRESGVRHPILLLEGLFARDEAETASRLGLTVVVHSEEQLLMLEKARLATPVDVFVKINTGMNRLGLPPARYWAVWDRLKACSSVRQRSVMTHFATADGPEGVADQLERFDSLTGEINCPKSLANSAAILRHPDTHADWVRPGIMLYGSSPFGDQSAANLGLQAAMTLQSALIGVQNLSAGDSVGYGRLFTADRPMHVGIVACGYADGYPRHAPTGTPVMVAGKRSRTLGRVSMDMLCVDLTDIPEAQIGTPVELWGANVAIDDVATAAGTVGYELMCALARRVRVEQD